jgi:1-acyl-sn-glycerol-3-phosphate acyltransferase
MANRRPRRGGTERRGFWFSFCIALLYPLNSLLARRDRRGWEHLPAEGGAILAANHISVTDPLIIARDVYDAGRLPHYLAKDSLFRGPTARLMRGAGQIPVYRGTADAAKSLGDAVAALQAGYLVIIYPEGTTSRDPALWPMQARTGVARLALMSGVPVLPLAQWGAHEFYRRGSRPHPFRRPTIRTRVGAPLDLSAYEGKPQTPALLREVTDLIMGRVTDLLVEIRPGTPPEQVTVWHKGQPEPPLVELPRSA